ncbi:type I restriction-modification system subunit M [Mycoplasmatota bacterium]|nr:type I restriction-modification system subunit M [Mycoplasmatota bacterium]
MSNQKERERAQLHKTIWQIANDLRGSVDGWDFKQYVLGMLFYRFISENLVTYLNKNEKASGYKEFNYENLSDEVAESASKQVVDEKGFFILPSELFSNVAKKAKNDEDLNITLENIFKNIEKSAQGTESEDNLKGLFDDIDVNSNKLGRTVIEKNDKLRKLITAVDKLRLGKYEDNTIDAFGDAYEFLMTMYAANAGKSGGEFFTPQEVSELLTKLTLIDFGNETVDKNGNKVIPDKEKVEKVYDPACGSGSLLLKFAKILGKDNVKLGFFGQEINLTTYNLARINMFLHDINFEKFDIAYGDTLKNPVHWDDKPFEAIVSNPPYSTNWDGKDNPLFINDERFAPAGVLAPKSKADYAFVMHILNWLSSNGTAAIVEFPGILYRGGTEQKIRKYLIDNNFIDSIIQLPSDLFFGNTISTAIMILRKNKSENKIHFIDASDEFVRLGTKNKLTKENISRILESVRYKTDEDHFSRYVVINEIVERDYNLSVNTYIETENHNEEIDNVLLNLEIKNIVKKIDSLRKSIDEIVANLTLLSFDTENTRFVKFGDVATIIRGASPRPIKDYVTVDENGVNWIKIGDAKPGTKYITESKEKITLDGATKSRYVKPGDFILSNSMSFGRPYILQIDGCIHDGWLAITDYETELNSDFLYHLLSSNLIQQQMSSGANIGTVKNLNANIVKNLIIPIPSIEIQIKIASILDAFEILVNDIKEGLPAEIEARRKQYEYYRNKLLKF